MKPTNIKRYRLRLLAFLLAACGIFNSCKKVDVTNHENVVERFLKVPANASPQVLRIIDDLKKKNEANPFIEQFVANVGYPLWEYAKIGKLKPKNNYLARDGEPEELMEVPVVLDAAAFVNAIMSIKLDAEPLYKLFKSEEWASNGFDKDPNRVTPNADDVVAKIMAYEKEIWAEQFFKINDNRIFDYWPQGYDKPLSFCISIKFDVVIINVNPICKWKSISGEDQGAPDSEWQNLLPVHCYPGGWTVTENNPLGGGTSWTTVPSVSSNGGSNGGNSQSGESEGPCNPNIGWVRLEVRNDQPFNPCLDQVIDLNNTDAPTIEVEDLDPNQMLNITNDTDDPEVNLSDMFNCFNSTAVPDAGATYSIKLCADIPVNDNPAALVSGLRPGHSFITITKKNGSVSMSQSFGFYPKNGILSMFSGAVESKIVDNGNSQIVGGLHEYNASITMDNLTPLNFSTIKNISISLTNTMQYDLNDYNCTDFALQIFNSVRSWDNELFVPDSRGAQTNHYYGTTPNALYKTIKAMHEVDPTNTNIEVGVLNAVAGSGQCP